MTNETKLIIEKARSLSAQEREEILEALLASLHKDSSGEADEAWHQVIDERLEALDRGEIEKLDFDEAVRELHRK